MVLLAIKMMLSIHDHLVRDGGHNRDALDSLDGDEDSDETRAFTLHGLNARSCTVILILMIADCFMIIVTDGVFEKKIYPETVNICYPMY